MAPSLKTRREFRAWQKNFDQFAPKTGDLAPDFELWDSDGSHAVRLSQYRHKKPVGLIFGSFT